MAYSKTTWVDGSAPAIDAAHLNNIEAGIENLDASLAFTISDVTANTSKIETNTADIATNTSDIATINTSITDGLILRKGTFSGTWNPTLDATFDISDYNNYYWIVNTHQTQRSVQNGDTVTCTGVLNADGVTLNFVSTSGATAVPAEYTLIAVKKDFSDYAVVNQ